MDLSSVDVDLLHVLGALVEQRSVTGAARALGRTQSSVSRTLTRIRALFGDPVLEPSGGRGLQLSSRGRELGQKVTLALEAVRQVFAAPTVDPRSEQRTFRIAAADYTQVVLLDGWIHALRKQAPGITIELHPVGADSIEPLSRGTLDLGIAPRLLVPGLEQFVFKPLMVDRLVCVLRRGHPAARRPLTLSRWLELEHVMVGSVLPNTSAVQEALHAMKRTRRVVARVPSMVAALHLVARSDLTCALPEKLIRALPYGVVTRRLPLTVAPLDLQLLWHPRVTTQPLHRWLRESLLELAGEQAGAGKR